MINENFFLRALQLARESKGRTRPNPSVGAVIEKDGEILGEGCTACYGGEHAERQALSFAGERARGATLYVTLEPCVDFPGKKTPACSDLILKAGISKVVYGTLDPHPEVFGKGIRTLEQGGLEVIRAEKFREELIALNAGNFKFARTGLPSVTAKYAMTLDGNIATEKGDSKWITGAESRKRVHEVRSEVDAVMVGVGTVIADNPRLTVRDAELKLPPYRLILDLNGRTPKDSFVLKDPEPTLFIVSEKTPQSFLKLCEKNGKAVLKADLPFDFEKTLKKLAAEFPIREILLEGGSRTNYSAFQAGVVDRVMAFISPKILGGAGYPPFLGIGPDLMSESLSLSSFSADTYGSDILIEGKIHDDEWAAGV